MRSRTESPDSFSSDMVLHLFWLFGRALFWNPSLVNPLGRVSFGFASARGDLNTHLGTGLRFEAEVALHRRATDLFEQVGAELALPQWDTLSMGMTADLEAAIAAGSTMVRVGTAIFGRR